ncbi:MAG: Lipase/esterase [candidate division WS6 bacterium GW2011_GWF2_39_15]|uniref:Lipase/esterase n=1 Tax=candidate division WS6 bacterium GW2011_GWF2_39_15 TaxID=1619100 RepID=A0A0G0Q5Q1_9BACT|nr:MAG: Lipase/esterase [candidate division WS6 bacterium GW2011_GWF2_39_15]
MKFLKSLLPTILVIIVGIAIYFLYTRNDKLAGEKISSEESAVEQENKDPEQQVPQNTHKTYAETPAENGALYFEKFPVIQTQQAYIAYPLTIDTKTPPTLVIYNHGSNTNVTKNLKDPFMKDLQAYAKYLTTKGFAFAASNQHGMNYGNTASIQDSKNLIEWIKKEYMIKEKVNMLGFSMGGLPAIYYAVKYPSEVNAMALLAPVTYIWGSSIYTPIKNIPTKIWHGTRDVNVGYSASSGYIERGKPYKINTVLRTVQDAGHFNIDTEFMKEIYDFFKENEISN